MIFWASSETHAPAGEASERVRRRVEPLLNAVLAASSLAQIDGEVQYIPIIMPPELLHKYRSRSRLKLKRRIYVCAPQLDYDTFVSGAFEGQLHEYLRGISLVGPHLARLGAADTQIGDFGRLISSIEAEILSDVAGHA